MPIAKPQPKATHELGIIAGNHAIVLKGHTSIHAQDNKQFRMAVTIEPDDCWHIKWHVVQSTGTTEFVFLDEARAFYDSIETKGAKR